MGNLLPCYRNFFETPDLCINYFTHSDTLCGFCEDGFVLKIKRNLSLYKYFKLKDCTEIERLYKTLRINTITENS